MTTGNHVSPCGRGGSNSHALDGRQILSRASGGESTTKSAQGGAGKGTGGRADVTPDVTGLPAEKRCGRCEETKPRAEYNLRRQDGKVYLQHYCRPCHAAMERERYAKSAECRAQIKRRDQRHATERTHIARAQNMAGNAIKRGRIPRGPCEFVGSECRGQIQGHHDDYSKPLEIRWLCRKHHVEADRARRALERAA